MEPFSLKAEWFFASKPPENNISVKYLYFNSNYQLVNVISLIRYLIIELFAVILLLQKKQACLN